MVSPIHPAARRARLLPLALVTLVCLWIAAASAQQSMQGAMYCEIAWGSPQSATNGSFTSTISFNISTDCAEQPGYLSITEEDVKAVHGPEVQVTEWNGPRVFTLERFEPQPSKASAPQELYEYGSFYPDGSGFLMSRAAQLETKVDQSTESQGYVALAVDRRATAVWLNGTTVYELVAPAPECTVFTMQSFFIGRDASGVTDASELPGLAESGLLVLPQGWTYRTRVLQDELRIVGVDGVANVTQDNLGNSYSQHDSSPPCPGAGPGEQAEDGGGGSSSSTSLGMPWAALAAMLLLAGLA